MNHFWSFVESHWGTISVIGLLILKWVYNAWPEGQKFPSLRTFLGEVIQEAPRPTQPKP